MTIDPQHLIGATIGVMSAGIAGWIGFVRRLESKVSRDEMHANLERRDTRVQEDLKRVLAALEKQNERSAEWRKLSGDKFDRIHQDIAVLKDRAGRTRRTDIEQ